MKIGEYIAYTIEDRLDQAKERLHETRETVEKITDAKLSLAQVDLNAADYTVRIKLPKELGIRELVATNFKGTLKDAIQNMERTYTINDGKGISGIEYSVELKVGEISIPIPAHYWRSFSQYAKPQKANTKSSKATPGRDRVGDDY